MTGSCKSDKWERRTRRIRVRQQSRECANSAALNFSEDKHVLCAAGCVQADRSTSKKVCDSEGTNSEQTLCLSFKLVILSFPSGWGGKKCHQFTTTHSGDDVDGRSAGKEFQQMPTRQKPLIVKGSKNTMSHYIPQETRDRDNYTIILHKISTDIHFARQ